MKLVENNAIRRSVSRRFLDFSGALQNFSCTRNRELPSIKDLPKVSRNIINYSRCEDHFYDEDLCINF